MREAIERYLALVLGPEPPPLEKRPEHLAAALDDIAVALRSTPPGRPVDAEAKPPGPDFQRTYGEIAARFPMLGYYPTCDPLDVETQEVALTDAIDDVADIAIDLADGLWRWCNIGADDAAWWLHHNFRTHWGRHLMNLRRYLHAEICDG